MRIILATLLLLTFSVFAMFASAQAAGDDHDDHDLPESFAPSAQHPFGRLNPDAPEETAQFAFMVGEFDRVDRHLQPDGSWRETRSEWNASFEMNGYAILDQSRNYETGMVTSNMRIFDKSKGKWVITWFKMPGYASVVAEGEKIGDEIIMQRGDLTNGERYVFHDIADDGYKWKLERYREGQMLVVWEIICTRRK